MIPIVKRYEYATLERVDAPEGRRYVYGEQRLPSVTNVLSSTKDMSHLDAWAERIGREKAEQIKNDAATVGTNMHLVMECLLAGQPLPAPESWLMTKGYEMGYRLVNTYFQYVEEVWGSEVALYYPEKYAGTTDMVAVYRGKPAIVDFKQATRPKKREWIEDYFHQLAAYALAHDVVHGTNIDYGVVLMAVQDGTVLEFTTTGREFQQYKDAWLKRVDQYYESMTTSDSVSIQTRAPQDSGLSGE